MMERMPVHCCCEPGKHLGWVPVEPGHDTYRFAVYEPFGAANWRMAPAEATPMPCWVTLRRRMLRTPSGEIEALDSDHQPVETLRKLRGWVDA